LLSTFGLKEERIETPFYKLSGGERQRTRLMLLFSKRRDLLILDEITNHLDLYSREALERAIQFYKGGIVFVSHDRYFIEKIKNNYYILKDGKLSYFTGTYDDFIKILEDAKEKNQEFQTTYKSQDKKEDYIKRKERQRKQRILKRHIQKKTAEIAELERKIEKLEQKENKMLKSFENPNNIKEDHYKEYEDLKKELKNLYRKWEELNIEMEKLEQDLRAYSQK